MSITIFLSSLVSDSYGCYNSASLNRIRLKTRYITARSSARAHRVDCDLGVDLCGHDQTNVNVGKDISARDLYEENDALVLCLGATSPRDLPLPGRELDGIYQAMAFLETWQKKQSTPNRKNAASAPAISAKDKDVIVLGGGTSFGSFSPP